jgi:F420-non-reducing hydrogenase large subunit
MLIAFNTLVDGVESGVYMATSFSQEQYEKFYATLGGRLVHQRLVMHWAQLMTDPEISSPNVHAKPTGGVGIVEAPRGTLTHHYWTDERGVVTKANLIVGTTNNYAPIQMSAHKAATSFIKEGKMTKGCSTC